MFNLRLFRIAVVAAIGCIAATVPASADVDHSDWLKTAFRPAADGGSKSRGGKAAKTASGAVSAATSSYGSSAESGVASFYWQPQAVASGGRFNPNALTAAHKTLPFGTRVLVTNLNNGRSVEVVINDRGPFVKGRVIDLSRRAAQNIGMTGAGLARVNVARL